MNEGASLPDVGPRPMSNLSSSHPPTLQENVEKSGISQEELISKEKILDEEIAQEIESQKASEEMK